MGKNKERVIEKKGCYGVENEMEEGKGGKRVCAPCQVVTVGWCMNSKQS